MRGAILTDLHSRRHDSALGGKYGGRACTADLVKAVQDKRVPESHNGPCQRPSNLSKDNLQAGRHCENDLCIMHF